MYVRTPKSRSFALVLALLLSLCLIPDAARATAPTRAEAASLRFETGGHAVTFAAGGVTVAGARQGLRVTFVGAAGVEPEAAAGAPGVAGRVVYRTPWPGVTVDYLVGGGSIYESTWTLAPGADAAAIRLLYSAPVALNPNGSLAVAFADGTYTESAPIAWQEIGGQRVPVEVAFRVRGRMVGFDLGAHDARLTLTIDPSLLWNSFLGGAGHEFSYGLARDASGNLYATGSSSASWGSPVRMYGGVTDCYIAKVSAGGALLWNTFLGGTAGDECHDIVFTGSDLLVVGSSTGTWGASPLRAFGGGPADAFVAKLNPASGALVWHTFLGGAGDDQGYGISFANPGGSIYVAGRSSASWGINPTRAYDSLSDGYVAKLDSAGALSWHGFFGGSGEDRSTDVHALSTGAIYVTGRSTDTWGAPNAGQGHHGGQDASVMLLDGNGLMLWMAFMGGSGNDAPTAIHVANAGAIYVAGTSNATWGSPVRAFSGVSSEAFVARLGASGTLTWNTFLGGGLADIGNAVTTNPAGDLYVAGVSDGTWGSPLAVYHGGADGFVAALTPAGVLSEHTFFGSAAYDSAYGLAVDNAGDCYVAGASNATWGSPVRAFTGVNAEAFAAQVDVKRPFVIGIGLMDPSPTNAAAVDFEVTFSESVSGVANNDFGLLYSVSGPAISSTACYGGTCVVHVGTGTGDGTLNLRVPSWADIWDVSGNPISGLPYLAGSTYTIDKSSPAVLSIVRLDPNPTSAATVDFLVLFSEPVGTVTPGNFDLTATGSVSGASVGAVSGFGATRTVTVNTGGGEGTLRLDLASFVHVPAVKDLAGNLVNPLNFTGGESYTLDRTPPTVTMASSAPDPLSSTPIPVSVHFNEAVTGFADADISPTNGAVSNFAALDAANYVFDLTPAGQGVVSAAIAAGSAFDTAGNGNLAAAPFSRTFGSVASSWIYLPTVKR